jgi:hypothetical protein
VTLNPHILTNSFDYSDQNEGTSFKAYYPDWRQDPSMDDFMKWGTNSFGETLFCLKKFVLMRLHFRGLTGWLTVATMTPQERKKAGPLK